MSTLTIARKDFLDVRRAKMVWFVVGIYVLLMGMLFYWSRSLDSENAVVEPLMGMQGLGAFILPLVALVAAYLAIAGERESGSIKYVLSLPTSRRSVVLGKFLSRALVVGGAVAVGFAVGALLAALWYPAIHLDLFVRFLALTLLYALVYVAIAIAISAVTASRSRAMGGAIAFYMVTIVLMLFEFSIGRLLDWVVNSQLGLGVSENAMEFLEALTNPTIAYFRSLELAVDPELTREFEAQDHVWYLEPEFMLLLLVAWLVVPLALGLWRFERAELG